MVFTADVSARNVDVCGQSIPEVPAHAGGTLDNHVCHLNVTHRQPSIHRVGEVSDNIEK